MGVWDGNHPADEIGRALNREGFVVFGIGLPFAAARAMCDYLDVAASDPDVIAGCVEATSHHWSLTRSEVEDVLVAFVQHIRQEANK